MSGTAFCTNCGARAQGTPFCTGCGNRMPVDPDPLTAPMSAISPDPAPAVESTPEPEPPPASWSTPAAAPLFADEATPAPPQPAYSEPATQALPTAGWHAQEPPAARPLYQDYLPPPPAYPAPASSSTGAVSAGLVLLFVLLASCYAVLLGLVRDGLGLTDYRQLFSALSGTWVVAYLATGLIGGLSTRLPSAAAIPVAALGCLAAGGLGPFVVQSVLSDDFTYTIWWWVALYSTIAGLGALGLAYALRGSTPGRVTCALLGALLLVAALGLSIYSIYRPYELDIDAETLKHLVDGGAGVGAALLGGGLGSRAMRPAPAYTAYPGAYPTA